MKKKGKELGKKERISAERAGGPILLTLTYVFLYQEIVDTPPSACWE